MTNQETGITRTAVSDEHGRYQVPSVPVGIYTVVAELAGFRTASRHGIALTIGREAVVDLTLEVGGVAQEIIVTGDAPMVNITSGGLGQVVEQAEIATLPLQGRNVAQIPLLEAGVQAVRTADDNQRKSRPSGRGRR